MIIFILVFVLINVSNAQTCGKSGAPLDSHRIVGGQVSQPGQWPWMALVLSTFTGDDGINRTFQCGGSIVSQQWVLTAAHCLHQTAGNERPVVVRIVVADHDITGSDGTEIRLIADQVKVHESYDPNSNVNDIGLLKLNARLDLSGGNPRIGSVCLPSSRRTVDRNQCYGIGWGRTSESGQTSDVLRHVRLPVANNLTCSFTWGGLYHSQSQLCAGSFLGGRDTCQGDSGGPLVCPSSDGLWSLEGITSFGIGCARPIVYGIYTRVSSYVPWITETTGVSFN